ncbi:MAG: hypothetical protein JJE23_12870, partial [Thermoleophilia bacterium]|nr:hypothetical protein [Thermoleophilia bacterium]
MREGPLADLFRSTEAPDDPPEPPPRPKSSRERESERSSSHGEETTVEPQPEPAADAAEDPKPEVEYHPRDEPVPADAEVSAYRSEDGPPRRREPKDRLRDVFARDREDREPAYGRGEPSTTSAATMPPEIHDPVIRVIGVGGGGVNAVNRMVEA